MSAPLRKVKKVPGTIPTPPSAPGSSTAPTANAEKTALGKVVAEGYARLPRRTRLIFGVAVGLIGLGGLYSQPVLNYFKLDRTTAQRHREIVEGERKRKRGSMEP